MLGEPGIGKSRFVAELAGIAGDDGTVLTGHCPAHGPGVTLWPLREAVAQAQRRPDWTRSRRRSDPAGRGLRVAAAVGLSEGEAGGSLVWAFRHLLGALARTRPLPRRRRRPPRGPALLDLLLAVLGGLRDAPILLVWAALARAGRAPGRAAPSWCCPRSPPTASRCSRPYLPARPGAERIVAAAGGNPLFLEQLVAYVGERPAPGALPPALHALLAARLDALDARDRATLALAAVTGDRCDPAAVHALATGVARAEVERACRRLAARDLLVADDDGVLRFRHTLIRDAAYASLAKAERARLHERHADGSTRPAPDPTRRSPSSSRPRTGSRRRSAAAPARARARRGRRLAAAARAAHRRGDLHAEIGVPRACGRAAGRRAHRGATLLPDLVSALLEGAARPRGALAGVRSTSARRSGSPSTPARVERERVLLSCHPETFDPRARRWRRRAARRRCASTATSSGSRARLPAVRPRLAGRRPGRPLRARAVEMLALAHRAGSDFDAALALMFTAWCLVEGPWPVAEAIARYDELAPTRPA